MSISEKTVAAESDALDALIQNALRTWGVPGVAVAVVHGDEEYYVRGHGLRDLTTGEPVTRDTLFGIASTTKAFTTTALAMLVDEGKLAWDDPVRRHLPWFTLADPLTDRHVTVRDLVTHRTGLARHDMLWYHSPWDREEIVRRIGRVQPSASFREKYQYNNIMFMAAGLVVEAASGRTWEEFVQERLFTPLGMSGANFSASVAEVASDHASPHRKNAEGCIAPIQWLELDAAGPGGSINAGVGDLSRWLRFQLGKGVFKGQRLLSEEALYETHAPQMIIRPDPADLELWGYTETTQQTYGMGWNVWDYRGRKILSHGGAIDGFRSTVCLVPDLRIGVAVLVNLGPTRMHEALRNALLDRLLGLPPKDWDGLLRGFQEQAEAEEQARKEAEERAHHRDTRPARELAAYVGRYREPAYGEATVREEGGQLYLDWSSFHFPLEHWHYDTYTATDPATDVEAKVTFTLNPAGEVERLLLLDAEFRRVGDAV